LRRPAEQKLGNAIPNIGNGYSYFLWNGAIKFFLKWQYLMLYLDVAAIKRLECFSYIIAPTIDGTDFGGEAYLY
jgi:hypothetical protein